MFDLLGREVSTLVDEAKHAGRYSVGFDATAVPAGRQGLPSGVYFYRLTAGSFVETKRMMVLK